MICETHIACEVKDFDPTLYVDRKEARRLDRFLHFAMAAAMQAVADAKLDMAHHNPTRVGVLIGSGIGGLGTLVEQYDVLLERGPREG